MIKPGILCRVIGGALHPSPNLGKIVTVSTYQGEHTLWGDVWRCTGEDLVSEYGVKAIALDFAADWLEPLKKVEDNQKEINEEKVA